MARYIGPVCKLCRREGVKLYLKGEKCFKDSCPIQRRPYPPGEHGRERRKKLIGYGQQLREKQKVKRLYGLLEKQFKNYFKQAERQKGITGENLLRLLERRLDNVVYRLGLASSRAQARQIVLHGHIKVNGRKVNIPSFLVKVGDEIELVEKMRKNVFVQSSLTLSTGRGIPEWISFDKENFKGKILRMPVRDDIDANINEHLIVELYSK